MSENGSPIPKVEGKGKAREGPETSYHERMTRALTVHGTKIRGHNPKGDPGSPGGQGPGHTLLTLYKPSGNRYNRGDFAEASLNDQEVSDIIMEVMEAWAAVGVELYSEALEFLSGTIHANDLSKEGAFEKRRRSVHDPSVEFDFKTLRSVLIANHVTRFRRFGQGYSKIMCKVLQGDEFEEYREECGAAWDMPPEAVPWVSSFSYFVIGCPPSVAAAISKSRKGKVPGTYSGKESGRAFFLDAGDADFELKG